MIFRWLLENGIQPHIISNTGFTASDLADLNGIIQTLTNLFI